MNLYEQMSTFITLLFCLLCLIIIVRSIRHLFYVFPTINRGPEPENSMWIGQIHAVASRNLDISSTDTCIIHFHGNAGCLTHRANYVFELDNTIQQGIFRHMNVPVFIFDYRGFGCSPTPKSGITPETMCEDGVAVATHLQRTYPHIKNWIYYGESIGTSVAAYTASQLSPKAMILQSPFYNIASLVADMVRIPFLRHFVELCVGDDFNTAGYLQNYKGHVFICHSPTDEVIPFINARRLSAFSHLHNTNTHFIEIQGGHNYPIFPDEFHTMLHSLTNSTV